MEGSMSIEFAFTDLTVPQIYIIKAQVGLTTDKKEYDTLINASFKPKAGSKPFRVIYTAKLFAPEIVNSNNSFGVTHLGIHCSANPGVLAKPQISGRVFPNQRFVSPLHLELTEELGGSPAFNCLVRWKVDGGLAKYQEDQLPVLSVTIHPAHSGIAIVQDTK